MSFTKPAQPVGGSSPTLSPTRTIGLAGAGLSLIAVCYGLARFAYGLFVPEFRESFTLTAGQTGLIAAAGYASYCVGVVAATTGTPRLGARAVAVAAGSLATAGTALIAVAPTAVVLAAGVTIAGVGTGVASPPLGHAIALRVVPRHRDRTRPSSTPAPAWASQSPAGSPCWPKTVGGQRGSRSPPSPRR